MAFPISIDRRRRVIIRRREASPPGNAAGNFALSLRESSAVALSRLWLPLREAGPLASSCATLTSNWHRHDAMNNYPSYLRDRGVSLSRATFVATEPPREIFTSRN